MELVKAQVIAQEVVSKLNPYCFRIEVAGSIRRKKPFVHDIDIVCIPNNQGQFFYQLQQLGAVKLGGQKLIRVDMPTGINLDVYLATSETWATLLLIRTGSASFNKSLCALALRKGLKLKADGTGLIKGDKVIASETELDIFMGLGISYREPWSRETF